MLNRNSSRTEQSKPKQSSLCEISVELKESMETVNKNQGTSNSEVSNCGTFSITEIRTSQTFAETKKTQTVPHTDLATCDKANSGTFSITEITTPQTYHNIKKSWLCQVKSKNCKTG